MDQLHVAFFPFLAHGHMIPATDMAKLFSSRGVKATIITTPRNAPVLEKAIEKTKEISIEVIRFPAVEAGLPEGCEHADQINSPEMLDKFIRASTMLQESLEQVLREIRPNCLVADMFFPWATQAAAKFNIPRVVFHGTSFFALCVRESLKAYKPFKNVSSDSELFILPNLPHDIKITRAQVSRHDMDDASDLSEIFKLINQVPESELTSYGVIVNSFYELEPEYARHYREVLKRKAWHIGPVSLCNKDAEEKRHRGKKATIDEHECLTWLDSKKPHSILYVSFGSMAILSTSQLHEIAMGLEASGQEFIWVLTKAASVETNKWMPEGFEERIKGKALIIRGWASQVLILDHEAIGGFVTHCGWNSILEGVCAGVPMGTWPLMAEQFYNEKLVTDVLRIGIPVGAQQWKDTPYDGVAKESIERAVKRIMLGKEAEEMREQAETLKALARKAVEEGGSSYSDFNNFIEELNIKSNENRLVAQ